jgi:hypothetical protein
MGLHGLLLLLLLLLLLAAAACAMCTSALHVRSAHPALLSTCLPLPQRHPAKGPSSRPARGAWL